MEVEPQLAAQNELQAGESLRWSGQPDPASMAMKVLPTSLLSIPVLAFMAFWMWGAAGGKMPDFSRLDFKSLFPLFGLVGVLTGLRMLLAPLWEYLRASRVVYGVTDRRAFILQAGSSKSVKSYAAAELANLERKEKADGSGDLLFGRPDMDTAQRARSFNFGMPIPSGFIGIRELRMVEQLLLDVAKSQPPKSSGGF